MRFFISIHQLRAGAALLLVVATAGCGESSTPQSRFVSDPETPATQTAERPTDPMSTNTFDSGVVPVAGELPALAPGKKPARSVVPADEEAAEDLGEDAMEEEEYVEPLPGTPEYKIRQLVQLKSTPANFVQQPVKGRPGEFEIVQLTPEQAALEQVRRWYEMIDLSIQVIATTKKEPKQEQLFNNGVRYLTEARKQLAVRGEPNQAQLLADDAEALYRRDQASFAAVESALSVVQLTQLQAEQVGLKEPQRAATFAKQARLFAEKFPLETNRAAMNLLAAGRLCEQVGLPEDAENCYTTIAERYPDSPFRETTDGVLRRLRLQGQKLTEFAGSTVEGGYISIEQFAGHPVLIVFWASGSKTFNTDLPQIQALEAKYGPRGLMVVGVNLDKDQLAVDRFVEKHSLTWQNIFFSDSDSRGVRNPVALHYGVTNVPTYWLVNSKGVVVAAPLDLEQLDGMFSKPPVKSVSAPK